MTTHRPLRGSCSCGRNNYVIAIPEKATDSAHIFFDSSSESRRTQAAPVSTWLHIPLGWFQSYTTSFFPDETHTMIRKSFTSSDKPHCKRYFCGFCGTHLTYWTESPGNEANYLNVTVGSLFGDDLRTIEQLGLHAKRMNQSDDASETSAALVIERDESAQTSESQSTAQKTMRQGTLGDMTWMEEIVGGSTLSSSQQTRSGVHTNADGTKRVEWEITEIVDDRSDAEYVAGRPKRKLGDVALGADANMEL